MVLAWYKWLILRALKRLMPPDNSNRADWCRIVDFSFLTFFYLLHPIPVQVRFVVVRSRPDKTNKGAEPLDENLREGNLAKVEGVAKRIICYPRIPSRIQGEYFNSQESAYSDQPETDK